MKKRAPKKPSAKDSVLILRVNPPDMVSAREHVSGGFRWPTSGYVEAPDWINHMACGNGLHGWLWGVGDIGAAGESVDKPDAKWMVVRVEVSKIIDLVGKVKFPRGWVEFCGNREDAVAVISHAAPKNTPVMFGTATAGDAGTATAGDAGTATAGNRGTATAGVRGTATAGNDGVVVFIWLDCASNKYRRAIGLIDGENLKPGVKYCCSDKGEIVEKK